MGKTEKKLGRWLANTPTDEPLERVMPVLNSQFESVEQKSGSHIVVRDQRLQGLPGIDNTHAFSVPVSKGQKVKGRYLKRIALAALHIEEMEDE